MISGIVASAQMITARRKLPELLLLIPLQLSNATSEGELVRGVAVPWFMFTEMIQRDPEAIYGIEPRGRVLLPQGEWPGRTSMGTQLLWRTPLLNGETLYVVRRDQPVTAAMQDQLEALRQTATCATPPGVNLQALGMRMVMFGHHDDGSRLVIDCRAASA